MNREDMLSSRLMNDISEYLCLHGGVMSSGGEDDGGPRGNNFFQS